MTIKEQDDELEYMKRFKPSLGEYNQTPRWLKALRLEVPDEVWQDVYRQYLADIGEAKALGYKEGWDDAHYNLCVLENDE